MQCDTWQHQQQSGMHRQGVLCFASKSGSSSGSRSKGPPADINNNMDDMVSAVCTHPAQRCLHELFSTASE